MKLGTYSNNAMQRELFYLYKRSILIKSFPKQEEQLIRADIQATQDPLISVAQKFQHLESTLILKNPCHYHCTVLCCQFTDVC